jgi:diguanylate cyclase (GGDEF)-like protein/PAS domain S-box-containing protein
MRDEAGRIRYVIEFVRDISQRKHAEKALQESEERFRILLERLPGGVFAHDLDGRILFVNDIASENTGYTKEELLNMNVADIDPESIEREDNIRFWHRLRFGESTVFESTHVRKDGSQYPVEIHLNAVELQNRPILLPIALDITKRKQLEERLKELSFCDSLTSLYNRNFFEEEMRRLADDRYGPMGIVVCDIDGIKLVNDTLGHDKGDELIQVAGSILRRCFRNSDIAARIGGDEFAVLLPSSGEEAVRACCERVHREVERYNEHSQQLPISLSLGYAVDDAPLLDLHELLKRADDAMYANKQQNFGSSSKTVQALITIMEERDHIAEGHIARLQKYVEQVGASLRLSREKLKHLGLLAQFHDLGKVGVSDRVLFKPGALNAKEFMAIQRHCEIGRRIALSQSDLAPIADYILKHHEHWNGKGYPFGLCGEDIPLACRILAIADAFDAMTSDRPYRNAMSRHEAVQELRRCAGTQFDPDLVEQFIQVLDANDSA